MFFACYAVKLISPALKPGDPVTKEWQKYVWPIFSLSVLDILKHLTIFFIHHGFITIIPVSSLYRMYKIQIITDLVAVLEISIMSHDLHQHKSVMDSRASYI